MSTKALLVMTTLGWVGALGTVGAYALVSQRRMDAQSLRFQAINAVGAGMLALNAVGHHSWPSAASNLLWAFFGTQALVGARDMWRPGAARHWRGAKARVGHLLHLGARSRHTGARSAEDWTTAA